MTVSHHCARCGHTSERHSTFGPCYMGDHCPAFTPRAEGAYLDACGRPCWDGIELGAPPPEGGQ